MNTEQFELVEEWLKALIDERIAMSLQRDSFYEHVRRIELEKMLRDTLAGRE